MGRFQRSLALARASWSVLKGDKELALFPVLSFLGCVAVVAAVALVVWATGGSATAADGTEEFQLGAMGWVFIVLGYVGVAFVTTYFLAGLVAAADERFRGGDPTVGSGLRAASGKLHRLLPWALVSATVSVILDAIEERLGFLGSIISGVLGAAWAVVTFLAVPIIVIEDLGPIDALKRSGALFRATWGENIIGQAGLGLLGLVAVLPAMLLVVLAVAVDAAAVWLVAGAVALVWIAVASAALSALSGIYRTALYRYVVDGRVPAGFEAADLAHAFRPRL